VKQRLRLGAVSPKLMQVYRDGGLTLDQLMAFAITEDHARQEQVYENLSYNREPSFIRRDLTRMNVRRRIGARSSSARKPMPRRAATSSATCSPRIAAASSKTPRLLDRLVIEKLEGIAAQVQEARAGSGLPSISTIPHAHGMRRSLSASGGAFRGRRRRLCRRTGGAMTACRRSMRARTSFPMMWTAVRGA
jgi:ParB family chromosome partitioning protein